MKAKYINSIMEKIEQVAKDDLITTAAVAIVEAITAEKTIYTFGASHAGILSEEMFYRAGGLVLFNPIFDKNLMLDVRPIVKTSAVESLAGYGTILGEHVNFQEGDVLIAHSVSGRNAVMIDLVNVAKQKGVKIIAITNITYSKSAASRHSSGKRLFELADIVIDNHGEIGDATVSFPGIKQTVGPTSTVIGATIVNCMLVEIVAELQKRQMDIPIFYSANIDGKQNHNIEMLEKYQKQIKYM